MIVVKPMSGQTKIKVTGLYQWDQLRTLQFEDVYPNGTEVHFAIKGESVALVYLLENRSVRIPSVLLQRALPVMAWVNVGEATVLEIEMPVTPRSMPSDYVGIEDESQHSIEYRMVQLEQWQVETIKQMSDRYTKAETDQRLNLKADAKRVYTKLEASALLNEKADVNTVDDGLSDRYTKAEADGLLAGKADDDVVQNSLNNRYTKAETDGLLAGKADDDVVQNALNNRYTKAETDGLLLDKANKQQEEWIEPTLVNGWTPMREDSKPYFYKDSLGRVYLKGKIGTGALDKTIFILPSGYRPSETLNFAVSSNNAFGNIYISAMGAVVVNAGAVTHVSLDNVEFRAEG